MLSTASCNDVPQRKKMDRYCDYNNQLHPTTTQRLHQAFSSPIHGRRHFVRYEGMDGRGKKPSKYVCSRLRTAHLALEQPN